MQVHIVQAHPEPTSFNGALAARAQAALQAEGDTVTLSDLYASGFDPVERAAHYRRRADSSTFSALAEQRHAWETGTVPEAVRAEIDALEAADLLILQFPLWWHGPPAILKGWFDRVFLSGGLYDSRTRYDTGHFRGRRAILSVTSGAPEAAFGPGARGGDPAVMLWPLHYSLHYMGFEVLRPFWTFGVQGHGYSYQDEALHTARLREQLERWGTRVCALDTEPAMRFPTWRDWDANGSPLVPHPA
jgi:NAD(P)H dehydrogenase (quinone)